MATHPRISRDPEVLFGKAAIRGTRISVEFILDLLAADAPEAEILANYPHLTHEDILACVSYARDLVAEQKPLLSEGFRGREFPAACR